MKKDVYRVSDKKKSSSATGSNYEEIISEQGNKQQELGTKLEKTDTRLELQISITYAILVVMTLALVTLFYDAIKFHIDYSSNNKDLYEFERRLDRLELQNKLIFKKYPDIFDGLSLQDLQ